MLVLGGLSYLTVQYLQLAVGLSPLQAGLWTLPSLAAGIAATALAPSAVRRVPPGTLIGASLALASVGCVVMTQVGGGSILTVVVGQSVLFAGLLPVNAVGVDLVVGAAPPQRAGAASAVSETTQELGTALGIALLGSLAAAVYSARVADALPEGTVDATAAAQVTLGAAAGTAGELPEELLTAAREGFTDGLQAAATASAVALVIMAVISLLLLRRVPVGEDDARRLAPDALVTSPARVPPERNGGRTRVE